MLEAARENGLEGLLAKRASSFYESKRSSDWMKIKIVSQQEFVVGGFTEPQGDRYVLPEDGAPAREDFSTLKQFVRSLQTAGTNLTVLKTAVGAAQSVAVAIDSRQL